MASKLRKAIGAVKDQTSISLAKVGNTGLPDVDVALLKATSHDEAPLEEKYVQELLYLTSASREHVNACISGLAKRLRKTRNWIVAIKTLMLAHRLIRDGDPAIEHELASSRKKGIRVLNVYDFRDESHSNGWDFSAFVRAYGLYLDERLDSPVPSLSSTAKSHKPSSSYSHNAGSRNQKCASAYGSDEDRSHSKHLHHSHRRKKPVKKMRSHELLKKFPLFQQLVERALACKPLGIAKTNRLVLFALHPIVRESFLVYSDIRDGMAILLDAFIDMDQLDCIGAFDIYSRVAKLVDELISFYDFCKSLGVCKMTEYPIVNKIPDDLLETMDASLRLRLDSTARDGSKKNKAPQVRSVSFQDEVEGESSSEANVSKTSPPPPPPPYSPCSSTPRPLTPKSHLATKPLEKHVNLSNGNFRCEGPEDLLDLKEPALSSQEHENKLALPLFSSTETSVNISWENFLSSPRVAEDRRGSLVESEKINRKKAGWELALMEPESDNLSKPVENVSAGGFDRLHLDSLYEQGIVQQRRVTAVMASSGSASSLAMPGFLQSNLLALPAPPELVAERTHVAEDPFAASLNVPPPAYVQMAEMRQKQHLLVQEQQQWLRYQQGGMNGYGGPINFATNPFATSFQSAPYYSAVQSYYG